MLFKKVYLTVLFIMVFFLTITATEFHGVCVGINDYPGTDNDLDYCINDAQELRNALINFHNWSSGNISLLTDSNADESDIINAINNMPRTTGTNTSFFSYAGHGATSGLFTHSESYLNPSELQSAFGSSYNQYVCFLDACQAGVFTNSMTKGVVSSATRSDEYADESPSLGNGVFSYYLIQGLENSNVWGSDNLCSAEELHEYAAPLTTTYNSSQHPQLKDNYSGSLYLTILPPSASVSPTTNNVGSVKADTYVSGSFTITNTGGEILSLTIQSQTNFDLDPSNQITYEPIIYKTLIPGSSTTVNYDGYMGGVVDYGSFTSTITIIDNANSISKTHTVIGTLLLPDFCYGETESLAASPEELLFDKAFVDFYVADTLQVETKNGEKREKKSIKERLDFAYNLLKKEKTEKVENICKEIIELYPESEMGISFYAIGLLWEASLSKEAPEFGEKEFKSYLKELTERKEKYKINGYAQLILSLLDVGNDIEGLERLFSDYKYDGLKELALFHQFIHYYIYKQNKEIARKVSDQLDKMFVDSRYGYQAHLIFGDEGYTLEGLKELLKKKQESLLAKRGESKNDILSVKLQMEMDFWNT